MNWKALLVSVAAGWSGVAQAGRDGIETVTYAETVRVIEISCPEWEDHSTTTRAALDVPLPVHSDIEIQDLEPLLDAVNLDELTRVDPWFDLPEPE